jgi:hypothetical protein
MAGFAFGVGKDDDLVALGRDEGGLDWRQRARDELDELERVCKVGRDVRPSFVGSGHDGLQARPSERRPPKLCVSMNPALPNRNGDQHCPRGRICRGLPVHRCHPADLRHVPLSATPTPSPLDTAQAPSPPDARLAPFAACARLAPSPLNVLLAHRRPTARCGSRLWLLPVGPTAARPRLAIVAQQRLAPPTCTLSPADTAARPRLASVARQRLALLARTSRRRHATRAIACYNGL